MRMERILWSVLFGALIAWSFYRAMKYEREANRLGVVVEKQPGRLTAILSPLIMPGMLLTFVIVLPLTVGFRQGMAYILGMTLEVFFALSVYYVVLLCCLPLLRKVFSARACATLWVIPSFLYWAPHMWRNYPVTPKIILRLPRHLLEILIAIWLVGFIVVLGWKIVAHLLFRREVLVNAQPVCDPEILTLWRREQELIERKKNIPLLYSDKVVSPMTIGCGKRTIRTLLPQRNYTLQELKLIFRHELRHVQRLDVETKMFYGFCEALCWFNPLMWIAMGKAAADLELSCDEMVLYDKDAGQRRMYAELLLDSACDDRGFTTCLSASAKTLRYRLKNVVQERKRFTGVLLVALSMVSLLLCCGMVVVSVNYGTMQTVILDRGGCTEPIQVFANHRLPETEWLKYEQVYAWDHDALLSAVGGISVSKMLGQLNKFEIPEGREICLEFDGFRVWIDEEWLRVYGTSDSDLRGIYHIDNPVDWDAIFSALDFEAPDPTPGPVRPSLSYYLSFMEWDEPLWAIERVLEHMDHGEVIRTEEPLTNWDHAGGVDGYPIPENATVRFAFSYAPEWYIVEVIGQNGEEPYTVEGDALTHDILKLAPYSANYRVRAFFESYEENTYDMEFYFRVEFLEEEGSP